MPSRRHPGLRVPRILLGFLLGVAVVARSHPAQEPSVPPTQESSTAPAQGAAPPAEQEAPAAEEEAPPPGTYSFSGVGSFGYRFVDLNGSAAKYNELLNLQQGFRFFDGQFNLQRNEPGQGWFDRLSVTTQGLGGDPYPLIRADLRKNGVYELRTGYRATQYFYDLPQTDLTPQRGWIDRRRFADAELRYTPTRALRFRFFYNRTERVGNDLATSPFFYLPLGLNVWEAIGRANAVPWVIPIREEANLFGGGVDLRLGETNIHLEQSYRTYNNPANLKGFSNQAIQLGGLGSPLQNLVVRKWDSFAGFNIPTTSLRVDQELAGRLQLRAGYIYARASGPTSLDGVVSPLSDVLVNYTGTGTTEVITHTAEGGFTLKLFEAMDLLSDYRYQTVAERGTQSLRAVRSDFPDPVSLSQNSLRWDFGIHTVDTVLSVVPRASLNIRAGLRFLKQDIVRKENDKLAPGTQRTWSYTPLVNVGWTPSKKFSLRGDFESRVVVDPYVRITPENTVGSTIRARFYPSDRWGIDNTWSFRNWKTEDIGFLAHSRSNSTSLWFQPFDRLGFQGGFNYRNFSSENTVRFQRGIPPLTGLLSTDQTIDHTYFVGVKTNPKESLTLSFTGQFIRSTGLGTFTGETSTYGPLTWPACTAEIAYTASRIGRVAFTWQRSYYHEDLFRAADYSANAFTLRFERAF